MEGTQRHDGVQYQCSPNDGCDKFSAAGWGEFLILFYLCCCRGPQFETTVVFEKSFRCQRSRFTLRKLLLFLWNASDFAKLSNITNPTQESWYVSHHWIIRNAVLFRDILKIFNLSQNKKIKTASNIEKSFCTSSSPHNYIILTLLARPAFNTGEN